MEQSIEEREARARLENGQSPRDKARDHQIVRRARLKRARERGTHTLIEWRFLVRACGNACVKCGRQPVTKDHIRPLYHDVETSTDALENLQPLCLPCNSSTGGDGEDYRPARVLLAIAMIRVLARWKNYIKKPKGKRK